MENNEKNNLIDELLKDYNEQKKAHEDNFGEIEKEPAPLEALPQIEKRSAPKADEKMQESTDSPAPRRVRRPRRTEKTQENIEAPASRRVRRPRRTEKKERKPINKEKIKAVFKKIGIVFVIIAVIVGLVFAGIGIFRYAQSAYLKPYKEKYPDVEFPVGIEERFCDYFGENPTTVGYISIDDIGYENYILADNNGENPMLDDSNNIKNPDFNTVVYLNGKNDLEKTYATAQAFQNSSKTIKFSTLFDDYNFSVIGAYYTNADPEDDNGYVFPYNLTKDMTADSFEQFTDRLYHRFLYNAQAYLENGVITAESRLITVVTKTDFMPNYYFAVVGVLDGRPIDAAEPSKNVHYPQSWYTKNGTENIYRFASKWYPEIIINDEQTSKQSAENFTKF